MGNLLFVILHIICVLIFIPGLILTIPLHLIYSKQGNPKNAS
jgi:hypothetical protein